MSATIHIKRAYAPPAPEDGARILVDRLWPRGVSKARLQLDAWLKGVAPSTGLRRWFGHRSDRWTEFGVRYREELDASADAVNELLAWLDAGPVTLIYAARDPEYNHARVLRDYLQRNRHPQ